MTESEWDACTEPQKMLEFLRERGGVSERELRLFGCACVRRVWHLMADERSRQIIEAAELFADQLASPAALGEAGYQGPEHSAFTSRGFYANWAAIALSYQGPPRSDIHGLHGRAWLAGGTAAAAECSSDYAAKAVASLPGGDFWHQYALERGPQASFLRDIMGPVPFRQPRPVPPPSALGTRGPWPGSPKPPTRSVSCPRATCCPGG